MEEEKGELDVSSLDVFNKKPSFPFIKVDDPGFTFKAYIDPMDTPILSPYTPLKKISHTKHNCLIMIKNLYYPIF